MKKISLLIIMLAFTLTGCTSRSVSPDMYHEDVSQGIEDMELSENNSDEASDIGQGTWKEDMMPQDLESLTDVIFDDFIYPERIFKEGMPKDAEMLRLELAGGAWKYELFFDNTLEYKEIGTCTLFFGQDGAMFDLYPSLTTDGYDVWESGDVGYVTYSGVLENDLYVLQVPTHTSTVVLGPFYQIEGTQIGFGSVTNEVGQIGSFLFVRP